MPANNINVWKIKEWDYMGKRYKWTSKARHQGYIECTCKDCQKCVRRLVKTKELIILNNLNKRWHRNKIWI